MSSNEHTTHAVDLGRDPIGPLLCRLALPTITAQIVNLLYNIVDRIYIGRIPLEGKLALTGMGVTFPVITLISAFSALVGMGGAPRASIALGAGEKDRAERTLGTCATALRAEGGKRQSVFPLEKRYGTAQQSCRGERAQTAASGTVTTPTFGSIVQNG